MLGAEQVVLRHILAGGVPARELLALDEPGAWSSPVVAGAARLLVSREPGFQDAGAWLVALPDTAEARWLRDVWAQSALAEVPWDDACRSLRQERIRRRLAVLERKLAGVEADGAGAGMLARLLVEYKRLRSDLFRA